MSQILAFYQKVPKLLAKILTPKFSQKILTQKFCVNNLNTKLSELQYVVRLVVRQTTSTINFLMVTEDINQRVYKR